MRSPTCAAIAAVLVLAAAPATAEAGLPETFASANESFWSGDHAAAIAGYEELLGFGVRDADVFYNLGTAYARSGRHGPAILNFERALRLEPDHADARHNLATIRRAMARERTRAGEDADLDPPRSFWMNLLARISPGAVGIPFLVCWVLFFATLAARRATRRELARLVLVIVAPLLAATALVTGTLFASKAIYDARVQEAIAVGEGRVTVREGPSDRFLRAYDLREGDRVRVVDQERDWIMIRDVEGREGWGQAAEFGLLRL